jgi:hypothetical protein
MTARVCLAAVLLASVLASCSSETQTVTVAGPTVTETETETVTETVQDDDGVAAMAGALCREYGPLARTFGGLSSAEEIADELAEDVAPELRDAARRGCLAELASG